MTAPGLRTPRERARAQLTLEIKNVARRQLAEVGAAALSMRSIARELGLGSASALYRYFPSRDAILTALIIDAYDALGSAAEMAEARVREQSLMDRWMAASHGVRDWALAHPQEYGLIFGSPVPGYTAPEDTIEPANRVPRLLTGLLAALVAASGDAPHHRLPVSPAVARALRPALKSAASGIPDELVIHGVMAWTYLFGAISFEVFGHRREIVGDPAPFFDHEVRTIAMALGITGPS